MKTTRFFIAALLLMASFFVVGCGKESNESDVTPSDSIPNNTENPTSAPISNDYWVDLGLPSGLLWATCNVGATKPEDYGDYFAWGETQPKRTYTWGNYKYYRSDDNGDGFTKYCPKSSYGYNGYHDNLFTLQSSDDAAAANVPGSRMPTRAEWEELGENCTWKWITLNGVNGMCVTGPSGKSLFLPAAGNRLGDETDGVGYDGYYWSSSLNEDYPRLAWYLDFYSDGRSMHYYNRTYGFSVRPVR
ncbi:MAG: hypothetical protein IJR13_01300 [Bacteroidales bacterium]|nr:hypothetical protein [Bacteroidales bacterium]